MSHSKELCFGSEVGITYFLDTLVNLMIRDMQMRLYSVNVT